MKGYLANSGDPDQALQNAASNQVLPCLQIVVSFLKEYVAGLGGSVGCASDWRPGGRGIDPR